MGAVTRMRLAAAKSAEGLVVNGEVCAPGGGGAFISMEGLVGRSVCTSSRMVTVHVSLHGDGGGRTACVQLSRCMHTRHGLPYTAMEQGGVVQELVKTWKGRFGSTSHEDWRETPNLLADDRARCGSRAV